jgi:hypothetical protein
MIFRSLRLGGAAVIVAAMIGTMSGCVTLISGLTYCPHPWPQYPPQKVEIGSVEKIEAGTQLDVLRSDGSHVKGTYLGVFALNDAPNAPAENRALSNRQLRLQGQDGVIDIPVSQVAGVEIPGKPKTMGSILVKWLAIDAAIIGVVFGLTKIF